MIWKKISVEKNDKGEKTIVYGLTENGQIKVESRTRAIEHAAGFGYMKSTYWLHTDYYIVLPDGEEIRKSTLAEAKSVAEKISRERGG